MLYPHSNPVEPPVCVGSGIVVVNTGIAEITRLLNEAHAENLHHKSLRSQSTPRLICLVRHTDNTFSWPKEMLAYSWEDASYCRIICCQNKFGQSAVIIRSTPITTDFSTCSHIIIHAKMIWVIKGLAFIVFLMASLQSRCKSV